MRSILIIILTGSLAGCGSVQSTPAPPVKLETVQVNTPIAVSCIKASDIPSEPPMIGDKMNGDSVHDLDLVAASALRLRAALERTIALLGSCAN